MQISAAAVPSDGPIEIANRKTYGLPSTVQAHVLDSRYYETAMLSSGNLAEILEEARKYVKSVEPYMPDSVIMPSPFLCIVYRLFTLGLTGHQMKRLLDNTESPFIRCLGFVYLRFALHNEQLWGWLGEYVTDDEEFQTSATGGAWTTIGDFVEALLIKEKYFNTLLPRISGGVRRQLEEKLAPVAIYRKRMRANRGLLDIYRRPGTQVEVCIDTTWYEARTVDVEEHPSRPKVVANIKGGDGFEQAVHLGMVILAQELPRGFELPRERSRSRSRTDWTRIKGKTNIELVEELRQGRREMAVCTSGKDYGRRPSTFDKGLAMAREGQGVAARRLLEEETFIKARLGRANSPDRPSGAGASRPEPSEEHKERMRKLFEKYGNVQGKKDNKQANNLHFEGPDVMRLG